MSARHALIRAATLNLANCKRHDITQKHNITERNVNKTNSEVNEVFGL